MKRVLVLLCLVLLVGCGKKDPKIYDQDGPVADGDTLIEPSWADAKNLNPPLIMESAGGDIAGLVFNGLLRYNEKLEFEPCLAEKWTVSKDGKTINYTLRKGVKFHDGVEMTAEDVLFTYKVYSDPTVNTPYASDYQDIKSVEIMGTYAVKVVYKKPFAPALTNFSSILPKHLLEGKDINKADFNRAPVGTGPYKFVEWKTDQRIVLEANPDYWEGKPHVKRFVMRIIPDQSTCFLELLNGGVDSMGALTRGFMTAEQYIKQTETPQFKDYYRKYETDDFSYYYIGWNMKRPMFKDKLTRQALTMAIDREAIVKNVIYGLGSVCNGPFIQSSWASNPAVKALPFDPAKSKKLLAQAGWKDTNGDGILDRDLNGDGKREPFKFTLITNQGNVNRERIATIVQQQLKTAGIQVDVKILEWTTFLSQFVNKKNYDAMVLGWGLSLDPDVYAIWHSSQTAEHQYNHVGYKNVQVDRLLEEGRRTLDPKRRQAVYRRIHALIAEDQPYTFLYVPYGLSALHKRFKGLTVNRVGIAWHQEKWYVPKDQQKYLK